jgi:SAM-dependent methyltransferase
MVMSNATMVEEKLAASGKSSRCPVCKGVGLAELLVAPDRYHKRSEQYHLQRCKACSCVWLSNPPQPEEMTFHYGPDYYRGIAMAGEAPKRWRKQGVVISRYKQSGDILDIGCSSGGFLGTLKGQLWRLYGIEIAGAMADRARVNTGAEVFVGDALSAPFAVESFDVVTCFDVLEHVYDPLGLLKKAHEWLRPGGIFYTMLPNINSWEARMLRSYWYGLELPRHLFHFSPKSLRVAMESVGFEEGHIETLPNSFLEHSAHYIGGSALEKLGFSSRSLSKPKRHSITWRIVRKGLRLSVISPFGRLASFASAGASMEAVFVKSSKPAR